MEQRQHYLLQFFAYEHLPPHLQEISKPFGDVARAINAMPDAGQNGDAPKLIGHLARRVEAKIPVNPEATHALRKIAEADGLSLLVVPRHVRLDNVLRRLLEAKDCAVRALIYKDPPSAE